MMLALRAFQKCKKFHEKKKSFQLLLLAYQIISGYVWARFSSYPGIPTPRFKRGRLHSDFVGFDMHAESLSV